MIMTTKVAKTSMIRTTMIEMAAEAATCTCVDDTASGKTCRVTVFDWLPNLPTTLHVYSKALPSVLMLVSSRNEVVPFFITLSFMSSHCIMLTARSVVQLRAARDPCGRSDSCPVIRIPSKEREAHLIIFCNHTDYSPWISSTMY